MNRLSALLAMTALLTLAAPAKADEGIVRVPCGYQQLTSIDTAASLTIPTDCGGTVTRAVITAEAQAVRYRDDGTSPTASVGMPLAVGVPLDYQGRLSAVKVISMTSGAKLNVLYYR